MAFTTPRTSAQTAPRQAIAVIGSGIAGMSAAWLLSQRHDVTLYEKDARLGGHSNTVKIATASGDVAVDTGFIVFNQATYPNLVALFDHLGVTTKASDMSFGVSLNRGRTEYSSVGASAFLAGGRNLASPRFWSMTRDVLRFYEQAPAQLAALGGEMISLGAFLDRHGYGEAFRNDHILPQAAAIWSASLADIGDYPACAFVRFFENHGLLKLKGRPQWRTIDGGSATYVAKLTAPSAERIRLGAGAASVRRVGAAAWVRDAQGRADRYDHVVIATHADQALAMLDDPSPAERALLGAFRYSKNHAVLHSDRSFMPHRRPGWASWNYVAADREQCVVSYWMNLLQRLPCNEDLFLTLNPIQEPSGVLYETNYEHPIFDANAIRAQRQLWTLQGQRNTWFCGAHFGAGFHEDGLQAGLAVAEQLGGVRRPWKVENPSSRIFVTDTPVLEQAA